jgi:hypothetical protein
VMGGGGDSAVDHGDLGCESELGGGRSHCWSRVE